VKSVHCSVFSRLFYADAHVGGIRRKA
jgi:hypothetical protein